MHHTQNHARGLDFATMTTDLAPNVKEGEKVNGHEALDLAETVRDLAAQADAQGADEYQTEGANKQAADVSNCYPRCLHKQNSPS